MKEFSIQTYTHKQLAGKYRCDAKTLTKWLRQIDELGPRVGNLYSPRQVKVIVERLGEPFIE